MRDVPARRAFNRALVGGSEDDKCPADVAAKVNSQYREPAFRKFQCRDKKCTDEETNPCLSPVLQRLKRDLADTRAKLEASRARQAKLDENIKKERAHIDELERNERDMKEVGDFVRDSIIERSRILGEAPEKRVSEIDKLIPSYEAIRDKTTNEKLREKVQEIIKLVLDDRRDYETLEREKIERKKRKALLSA